MKTQKLLNSLEEQIETLAAQIKPIAQSASITSRFDQQLFHRKSHQLSDCLFEIKHHFNQLKNEVITLSLEQVTFLTEKIIAQISAITRESAIQTLREQENQLSQKEQTVDLYERLVQHQDYERRLVAMINDREQQLDKQQSYVACKKLQQEIAALTGRLARCRQALSRIEKVIERYENQNCE
ncbi:MAG: primosomal replication protein PriC [Arsenophonus endosymbiont of Dermacentor nuttalli]